MTEAVRIAAVAMGGSTGETFAAVEAALRAIAPVETTLVDLLPFHIRSPGRMRYPGEARVVAVTPAQCGVSTRLPSTAANLALSGGPRAFERMIGRATDILREAGAEVVLFCHDRIYAELAFVRAAERLGIPTLLVQEGPFCVIGHGRAHAPGLRLKYAVAPLAHRLGIVPAMPDYGLAGHARIAAASSAYVRRWLAAGIPPSVPVVTGIPRYDRLAAASAAVASRRDAGRASPARVLFVAQPFARHGKVDDGPAERLQRVAAAGFDRLAATAPIDLVLRLHPRGGADDVATLRAALGIPCTVQAPDTPFDTAMAEADLIVGFYSSGLLESLACGLPVVCLRLPRRAFAEPAEADKQAWIADLGVPATDQADMFADACRRALAGAAPPVDRSRLSEEIGPIDGGAAARVAQLALDLARGGARKPALNATYGSGR